jgi:hypothetical protein
MSTRAIGSLGLLIVASATGLAASHTLAEYDACNHQAAARATSPSAFPGPTQGTTMTSPGNPAINRQPNATGRLSGSAGSPGTDAGTTSGIGATRPDSAGRPREPEARLRGMAPGGEHDDAYRQAYRDCMSGRGF